jgi:superfamily II DNA or RNA helicase
VIPSLGEQASKSTRLPFLYGEHPLSKRIEAVNKYHSFICSRIFDEGMDIPNIKNIIEIDFLGGSRRQQLQRVGRLMHSLIEGSQYHLICLLVNCRNMERDSMDYTQGGLR